jgi:cellulose synthase/poly-beta-1,6-N-acetylglucosamine synthase-like glycosyltransferase
MHPSAAERAASHSHATSTLSIIIPTLNEENNVERAIRSTRGGGSVPLEVIVVDGGSSDRTVELARACGATVRSLSGFGFQRIALWRAERRHPTGRERMVSPTLHTLHFPIVLPPWVCFRETAFQTLCLPQPHYRGEPPHHLRCDFTLTAYLSRAQRR